MYSVGDLKADLHNCTGEQALGSCKITYRDDGREIARLLLSSIFGVQQGQPAKGDAYKQAV